MYKPSTYQVITYFFLTYVPMYETYFLQKWSPRWNQILTQLRFHPQLSYNRHPVDGALVGVGSLLPCRPAQVVGIHGYLASFCEGGVVGIRPP